MFASYVGWVVRFGAPIVLVLPEPAGPHGREAIIQLLRIGYERVEGYLDGGIEGWRSAGRPVESYPVADVDDIRRNARLDDGISVLDVRQPREWEGGVIPGSLRVFVGDLPERLDEIPRDREVWTICASGRRAAIAASLLGRVGVPVRLVAKDRVREWLARSS